MKYIRHHFVQIGKPALAALLVGVILLLDAMAACPALHELIHHDADQPGHECAVTMFMHGKVDTATVEVVVPWIAIQVEPSRQIEFSIFSPAIENLPQGRAPPALRSVS